MLFGSANKNPSRNSRTCRRKSSLLPSRGLSRLSRSASRAQRPLRRPACLVHLFFQHPRDAPLLLLRQGVDLAQHVFQRLVHAPDRSTRAESRPPSVLPPRPAPGYVLTSPPELGTPWASTSPASPRPGTTPRRCCSAPARSPSCPGLARLPG